MRLRTFLLTLLFVSSAFAQSQLGTGAINGMVKDPHGDAVPEAAVAVVNTQTGLTRKTVTGSAGQFSVPVLPPGDYTVRIEKAGFATQEQKNVVVTVGAYNSTRYSAGPTTATTTSPSTPVLLTNVTTFGTPFGDGGPPDGANARRFQLAARFRF